MSGTVSRNDHFKRMRQTVLAYLLLTSPSWATQAPLSGSPDKPTLDACKAWAGAQGEDARYMWGQLENGAGSEEVGVLRLTLYCLGDAKPAIASFGSSADHDRAFCATRRNAVICKPVR